MKLLRRSKLKFPSPWMCRSTWGKLILWHHKCSSFWLQDFNHLWSKPIAAAWLQSEERNWHVPQTCVLVPNSSFLGSFVSFFDVNCQTIFHWQFRFQAPKEIKWLAPLTAKSSWPETINIPWTYLLHTFCLCSTVFSLALITESLGTHTCDVSAPGPNCPKQGRYQRVMTETVSPGS